MSTTTTNPMADFASAMINAQRTVMKDKDWKKTEMQKLEKEMQKELYVIREAEKVAIEAVSEPFKVETDKIKAKYKVMMEPHKLLNVEKSEEFSSKAADKVGNAVEVPVTAILNFADKLKSRFKKG